MSLEPRQPDIFRQIADLHRRVRWLEIHRSSGSGNPPFTIEHGWALGGDVDSTLFVPPLVVSVNSTGSYPERKTVADYGAIARSGAHPGVLWSVNGGATQSINVGDVLTDRMTLRPIVQGGPHADVSVFLQLLVEPGAT